MDLIRFFEIRRHLGQQLVRPHTDIDRKTQLFPDLVLQTASDLRRILTIHPESHVDEALIYRKLLKHRRIRTANIHKALGAMLVPRPVAADNHEIRT